MNKRILLIGGNFFPEPTGIGKYNGEMMDWFARAGWECTVISTSPYYPYWKVQKPYSLARFQKETVQTEGEPIEVYRCPLYVPTRPTGTRRLISEATFSTTAFLTLLRVLCKKRFDYVLTVAPPFQLGYHALLYKIFRGAKFLYHIQDLQIEAARDLKLIKSKGLIWTLFRLEKSVLKRADMISSICPGMQKKITEKTGRDTVFFPNWADTKTFYPLEDKGALKKRFGFSPADKIVLYSGAIGEKQGLEMIFAGAKALRRRKEVKFVICGSGPYKDKLQQAAEAEGLQNIRFMPLQPPESFNAFLNTADVHLVIQKASARDLVMPSKLANILAAGGLALITACPGASLYQTVREQGIGLLTEPENGDAFTTLLLRALLNDFSAMKAAARRYALESLSIDRILSRYEAQILALYEPQIPRPLPAASPKINLAPSFERVANVRDV